MLAGVVSFLRCSPTTSINFLAVPLTIIPLAVIMVNQHPVPVDDCPCFEDAIAFVSVLLGSLLGRWHAVQNGFDQSFFGTSMPGSGGMGWSDRGIWWGVASLKMVFGMYITSVCLYYHKLMILYRCPCNFHLAYSRQVDSAFSPPTDLPSSSSGIHPSQP